MNAVAAVLIIWMLDGTSVAIQQDSMTTCRTNASEIVTLHGAPGVFCVSGEIIPIDCVENVRFEQVEPFLPGRIMSYDNDEDQNLDIQ